MKKFKAILFDLNGTLVNIWTDENQERLYQTMAALLRNYGVDISWESFRTLFYDLMKKQRDALNVQHPEFDIIGIFKQILQERGSTYTKSLPAAKKALLPEFLAETFRAASMCYLGLYPKVQEILKKLQEDYILAAVSDAQKIWAVSEMRQLGIDKFFSPVIISSDFGYRKPAPELFQKALDILKIEPKDAIYVGNDTFRDVFGSKKMGMKNIYFRSGQGDERDYGEKSDYIIYKFEELLTAVDFLENH